MKLLFCEECGGRLGNTDVFCTGCGCKVPLEIEAEPARASIDPAFSGGWRFGQILPPLPEKTRVELWLTNSRRLREQLDSDSAARVLALVRGKTGLKDGWAHLMLDLVSDFGHASPDWTDHVAVLAAAEDQLKETVGKGFDAICIVGDEKVIPMAEFVDLTETDEAVESDAVYSTMSLGDPWKDEAARNFERATGRLPVGVGWGASAFEAYLSNTDAAGKAIFSSSFVHGVSAQCWSEASQRVLQDLGGGLVQSSPEADHKTLPHRWDQKSPWQYFNLHGAIEEPGWYGEGASDYPLAFLPFLMTHLQSLNVVGVEACYGARFMGLSTEESALLSALSHKTVAFLGSSKIAFGPPRPPNSLADVMIRDFLKHMRQGVSAGDAHLMARHAVASTLDDWAADPAMVIKTVLSFNLFGDPSVRLNKPLGGLARLIHPPKVPLRDTLSPVRARLDASMTLTQKRLQGMMEAQYRELQGIQPLVNTISRTGDLERLRWGWKTRVGAFEKHWFVLTDSAGKTLTETHSK